MEKDAQSIFCSSEISFYKQLISHILTKIYGQKQSDLLNIRIEILQNK